jgi:hypothetical protein
VIWPQHYFLMHLASFRRQIRTPYDAKRFAVCWLNFDDALERISYVAERQALRAGIEAAGRL